MIKIVIYFQMVLWLSDKINLGNKKADREDPTGFSKRALRGYLHTKDISFDIL
jgi:hypothetical protein